MHECNPLNQEHMSSVSCKVSGKCVENYNLHNFGSTHGNGVLQICDPIKMDMLYMNLNFVSTDGTNVPAHWHMHSCTSNTACTVCTTHVSSPTLKHPHTHAKHPNHACYSRIHVSPLPQATHTTPTPPWPLGTVQSAPKWGST